MMKDYEFHNLTWRGIEIEIRWTQSWVEFDDGTSMGHMEIRSISPKKHPLPLTETGYRSHFMKADAIHEYGGPANYAEAWLDEEAKTPAWQQRLADFRQLALF